MLIDVNRYRRNVYESLGSKESAGKRQFDRLLPRKRIVFLFAEASKAEVVLALRTIIASLMVDERVIYITIYSEISLFLITLPSRQINSRIIKFVGSTEREVCN